jgi:hypothetical protein
MVADDIESDRGFAGERAEYLAAEQPTSEWPTQQATQYYAENRNGPEASVPACSQEP